MVVYAMVMFLCGILSVLRRKSKTSYALSQSWEAPRLKKSMRLTNAAALRAAERVSRAQECGTSGRQTPPGAGRMGGDLLPENSFRPPRVLTSA